MHDLQILNEIKEIDGTANFSYRGRTLKQVRVRAKRVQFSNFTVLKLRTTTHRNVQRFRGVLVFKAQRLLYHTTLGLRVTKKKKKRGQLKRC